MNIPAPAQSGHGQSDRGPFTIMTVLFFMWGFITVLNDLLIPRLQDAFTLTNYQIMFGPAAFFWRVFHRVAVACACVAFYGWKGHQIGRAKLPDRQ